MGCRFRYGEVQWRIRDRRKRQHWRAGWNSLEERGNRRGLAHAGLRRQLLFSLPGIEGHWGLRVLIDKWDLPRRV